MSPTEKKRSEKEILVSVFRETDYRVIESERPDFRLVTNEGREFGVEITEFFPSETVARLGKKLDLPTGGSSYNTTSSEVYPSLEEQIDRLNQLIAKKSATVRTYRYPLPVILLIRDSTALLGAVPPAVIEGALAHLAALPALKSAAFVDVVITWETSDDTFAYSLRSRSSYNPNLDPPIV